MNDFLKQWGTLIIAAAAFILSLLSWMKDLWERYIRKGIVEIHETGNIELTYGMQGEMIGLHGTLLATGKDVFIRSIELLLVRLKDNSTHRLDWALFGPEKMTIGTAMGDLSEISCELPHGFIVLTSQPHRYYTYFADRDFQDEARPIMHKLLTEWNKAFEKSIEIIEHQGTYEPEPQRHEFQRQTPYELYQEFSQSEVHVNTWDFLNRHCYWEAGRYKLQMVVKTSHPEDEFKKNWQFELTEDDVRILRINAVLILRQCCGEPVRRYNVAIARYE